jgi:hypothetical protein
MDHRIVAAACTAALGLTTATVRADEVQDHVDRAAALEKGERYRDALRELQAAYALRPSGRLSYLEAKVHQRLGDAPAALASYQEVLARPPDGDQDLRTDARDQIARLSPFTAQGAPPQLHAPGVSVLFEAKDARDRYLIASEGRGCPTPCRLTLTPGDHPVFVGGEGQFDFALRVDKPGRVRVQHPLNTLLTTGIAVTLVGSAMMIGGNLLCPNGALVSCITFGWAVGPVTHIVGVGLLGAGAAKLSGANSMQPITVDVAPVPALHPSAGLAPRGMTARLKLAF